MGLFSSAFVYTFSNGLNAAIPFLLLPVLTRVLRPEEYALIAMFQAIVAIASIFTGIGLNGAVRVRYFKGRQEDFPGYLGTVLIILGMSTMLVLLVALLISGWISDLTGLSRAFLITAVLVAAINVLINIKLVLWQVKFRPAPFCSFRVLQTLLNALMSVYLVLVLSLGAEGRIYGIIISTIIFGLIALIIFIRDREVKFKWKRSDAESALNFGIPLIPHITVGVMATVADRFILGSKEGMLSVGIYFVSLQLAFPLRILADSLNQAFSPWGYKQMADNKNYRYVLVSYLIMACVTAGALIYMMVILFSYNLLLGGNYQGGKSITIILVAAGCFYAFYLMVAKSLIYTEKTKILSVISGLLGLFYLYLAVNLVDHFGIQGMAWAYFIFQLLMFICVWYVANRVYPQPWMDLSGIARYMNQLIKLKFQSAAR